MANANAHADANSLRRLADRKKEVPELSDEVDYETWESTIRANLTQAARQRMDGYINGQHNGWTNAQQADFGDRLDVSFLENVKGSAREIATAADQGGGAFLAGFRALYNEWGPGPVQRQEKTRSRVDTLNWDMNKEKISDFARRIGKMLRKCPAVENDPDRAGTRIFMAAMKRTNLDFKIPAAFCDADPNIWFQDVVRQYRNHFEDYHENNATIENQNIYKVTDSDAARGSNDPPPASSPSPRPAAPSNTDDKDKTPLKRGGDTDMVLGEMKKLRADLNNQQKQFKNSVDEKINLLFASAKGADGNEVWDKNNAHNIGYGNYNAKGGNYWGKGGKHQNYQNQYWNQGAKDGKYKGGSKGFGSKGSNIGKGNTENAANTFTGVCNICGGWGHKAEACPTPKPVQG